MCIDHVYIRFFKANLDARRVTPFSDLMSTCWKIEKGYCTPSYLTCGTPGCFISAELFVMLTHSQTLLDMIFCEVRHWPFFHCLHLKRAPESHWIMGKYNNREALFLLTKDVPNLCHAGSWSIRERFSLNPFELICIQNLCSFVFFTSMSIFFCLLFDSRRGRNISRLNAIQFQTCSKYVRYSLVF